MKGLFSPVRKKLSALKGSVLVRRQLPAGNLNKVLNFVFRKVLRYEYEGNYRFNFLNNFFTNKYAISPIQKDEAILLFGLLKVVRPKTVVEFGFNYGHSSYVILNAIDKNAQLYSFDILDESESIANNYFKRKFTNFKFIKKSQSEFAIEMCDNKQIDFVFFDASHDLEINMETYERIKDHLSENVYIAIHDTGLWNKELMTDKHKKLLPKIHHKIIESGIAHQIDERIFVNRILQSNPELNVLHFHSLNCIRHGITVISKQKRILEV